MLLKDLFGELLETNYFSRTNYEKKTQKKALFLFKTVSLLLQQSKVIKFNTNLKLIKFYGGGDVFLPSYDKFRGIINRYDIICSTPEVIYKYFTLGFFKPEDLDLIIVDECHHTKGNDYINLIFKHFIFEAESANVEKLRIIGLTASPSDDKTYDQRGIENNIQDLCENLRSNLICSSILIKEVDELKLNEKNYEILPLRINDAYNSNFILKDNEKEIDLKNENFELQETPQSRIKEYILKELILQESLVEYLKQKYKLNNYCILNKLTKFIFAIYSSEEKQNENINGTFQKELYPYYNLYIETLKRIQNLSDSEFSNINNISFSNSKEELNKTDSEYFQYEIKLMEKILKKDNFLSETLKFIKIINLLIKYTDNTVLEAYCNSYLNFLISKQKQKCENFISFISNFRLHLNVFSNEYMISKNKFIFKSEYLYTLENFFLNKIKNNSIVNNKTIIFLHKRLITKYLSEILNKFLQSYGFFTTFVVGTARQGALSFSEEELKSNISSFEKEAKCIGLFATNVVEEGIDVPLCDNVINLCAINSMREFIQKSGRARKNNSTIYTCCLNSEFEQKQTIDNIKNLKNSIEIMKNLIKEDKFSNFISTSKIKQRKETLFIKNLDYYETKQGARVYLSYAKNMVNHFIAKLFNDGFTFIRAEMKVQEEFEKGIKVYKPYLNLPNCLEENFIKIFDSNNENIKFDKKEDAEKYGNIYEDYFYLKALKFLHKNQYLDDYLCFVKNYDELIHLDYNYAEYKNEAKISLKKIDLKDVDKTLLNNEISKLQEKEYYINIIDYDPLYIDLNLDRKIQSLSEEENDVHKKHQSIGIISEFKICDLDFSIFIPATQILHLYWINKNIFEFDLEELNLPKIEYNYYSKMNFRINAIQPIKINLQQKNLIDFYYIYSLFFSTDAEIAFYYLILQEKFNFSYDLFLSDKKLKKKLEYIFNKLNFLKEDLSSNFRFLKSESEINYNHLIKISMLKGDYKSGFDIDYEEIEKTLQSVKNEISNYYTFLKEYVISDQNEIEKYLENPDLIDEKAQNLSFYSDEDNKTRKISRNFLNFSKNFVCNFSEKTKRGNMLINQTLNFGDTKKKFHKGTKLYSDEETYQTDYLKSFGLITEGPREYLKTYCFDFNQRMLKYKINMRNLGRVHLKSKKFYIKKFKFLPRECLYAIENCSMDKIFLFGMIPTILFKLQHDLIYYYQAVALKNRFLNSFGKLNYYKMNLLIEALNSKSTMESQNYERLEFIGDAILKFLSSFEVFAKYPKSNRDLLYSKRRVIESNKNLFLKAIEDKNKLNEFLYTSPINFKRMTLKGFSSDEMFLFNIGFNRSFAKKNLQSHLKVEEKIQQEILINENDDHKSHIDKENKIFIKSEEEEKSKIDTNENAIKDQMPDSRNPLNLENLEFSENINFNDFSPIIEEQNLESDKTPIDINHFISDESSDLSSQNQSGNKNGRSDLDNTDNFITVEKLEDFVIENLEIQEGDKKPSRIISNKVLADFVESLTGYLFYMNFNLYLNSKTDNFFELPSEFLTDIGVLERIFDLENTNQFWLNDLENPNCKYDLKSRMNRVACLNNSNYHEFKNVNLLFQALSHPEFIIDKSYSYVNKSYQRLAFLGEAFVSFFVALYVYDNNPDVNECMLHKLKICGINHHIISMLAIKMKLDDLLLIWYFFILLDKFI